VAYYAVTAGISAFAFFAGLLVARRGTRAAIAGYAVALALLLAKAVLNHRPDWEYALFPWPDYIYIQSWLVYPLGLLCLGLAVGLLPRGRNRAAVAVLAGFVFLVSLWTERWIVVEPDASSEERADAAHHCVQSTGWSCGPACCVSFLSQYGIDATEGEMMRLCRTPSYGGTSLFRIARGLRAKLGGADIRIVDGEPDALRAHGGPAIVTVRRVHVVVVRFEGDEVVVNDPAEPGPERMPFADYRERFGGFAVVATRAGRD
jgi:hypothetical protein